jgi:MinD superfamily P-loop ATPase
MVPVIDSQRCTSCGECSQKCQFKALVNLPGGNTLVFPELCHSCGLCVLVCREGAITEGEREIGVIETGVAADDVRFAQGVLRVGEPMAGPLIRKTKEEFLPKHVRIIDCPPGTSCPVVEAISDADAVILVTEPTPFGLHDMKIVATVVQSLGLPLGVVINRDEGDFSPLTQYIGANHLQVLTRIPEDRKVAEAYSTGSLIFDVLPCYREHLAEITVNLGRVMGTATWRKKVCAA